MPRKLLEKDFNPENLIIIIEREFAENYFSSSELLNKIDSEIETRTGKRGKKRSLASLNDQLKKMCPPKSDLLERTGKGKNIRYRIHLIPAIGIEKFLRTLNCKNEYSKNEIVELIRQYQKKLSLNDKENSKIQIFNKQDFWNYSSSKMYLDETKNGKFKITEFAVEVLKFCKICGKALNSTDKIIATESPSMDEEFIDLRIEFLHATCYGKKIISISPLILSNERIFFNGYELFLHNNGMCSYCGLPLTPMPGLLSLLNIKDFLSLLSRHEISNYLKEYEEDRTIVKFILNPIIKSEIETIITVLHIDKMKKNYNFILKRTEEIYNELKKIYEDRKRELLSVYKKLSGDEIIILMQQPPYSFYSEFSDHNLEIHGGDLSFCCMNENNFTMMHPKCAKEWRDVNKEKN